jgi:hypothetical protein
MTFQEACATIVANKGHKALNYAVAYAEYGMSVTDPHEQKVQALYILNNVTHWRGDDATAVRIALKQAAGIKTAAKK